MSFPAYGEHDTDFTPDKYWPESDRYQIFIFYDYDMKTLTSGNFGIYGGGETPTPSSDTDSVEETGTSSTSSRETNAPTSATSAATTSDPVSATTSGAGATTAPGGSDDDEPGSSSGGISTVTLAGAIGGAIAGTLAFVGIIWFMRKRGKESRAQHGQTSPTTNGSDYPPPKPGQANPPSNQPWPYQQMNNAQSTTSVNMNSDYKGFIPAGVGELPNSGRPQGNNGVAEMPTKMHHANELPTQMHHDAVELYAMKETVEMMGDTTWNRPPPPPGPPPPVATVGHQQPMPPVHQHSPLPPLPQQGGYNGGYHPGYNYGQYQR